MAAKPKTKPTLGIIGTGSFGKFLAEKLAPHFAVRLVGRSSIAADFKNAVKSDYVVLAIPFAAYAEMLPRLRRLMPPTSVLIDVCSVKTLPVAAIREALPGQPLLATHPLFGPESAAKTIKGQTIIVCPQPGGDKLEQAASDMFRKLGLHVVGVSEAHHDQMMADLQGLTFFVARILALYGIGPRAVMTPSYQRLLELADLEKHHSVDLFATIQLANPYAAEARQKFLESTEQLAASLAKENHGN